MRKAPKRGRGVSMKPMPVMEQDPLPRSTEYSPFARGRERLQFQSQNTMQEPGPTIGNVSCWKRQSLFNSHRQRRWINLEFSSVDNARDPGRAITFSRTRCQYRTGPEAATWVAPGRRRIAGCGSSAPFPSARKVTPRGGGARRRFPDRCGRRRSCPRRRDAPRFRRGFLSANPRDILED